MLFLTMGLTLDERQFRLFIIQTHGTLWLFPWHSVKSCELVMVFSRKVPAEWQEFSRSFLITQCDDYTDFCFIFPIFSTFSGSSESFRVRLQTDGTPNDIGDKAKTLSKCCSCIMTFFYFFEKHFFRVHDSVLDRYDLAWHLYHEKTRTWETRIYLRWNENVFFNFLPVFFWKKKRDIVLTFERSIVYSPMVYPCTSFRSHVLRYRFYKKCFPNADIYTVFLNTDTGLNKKLFWDTDTVLDTIWLDISDTIYET